MSCGSRVQVAVLGPVEVINGGERVTLSPQLRRLLGLLVVADGASVSADRLAEYVADGNSDGSTLRTAVSRLRKSLGGQIESVDGGYRLILNGDDTDWRLFDELREWARGAPSHERVGSLTCALELWRGPAFGDLADEEWATGLATRLDASRAATVEDLAESLTQTGLPGQAIELLESHAVEHPYRERPVALLMEALAADGRTADALRTYERFRVTLRDHTGLEPSSELRHTEGALLGGLDPERSTTPSRSVLPTGTVTFLFTDIEGSTQRWQTDMAAMSESLAAHDNLLRSVIEQNGGAVFKHTGDGVCAVFTSSPDAIAAAKDAQRQLELPVRIGIHTGEAELRDRDYFGPALNLTARIMDAGSGGQILMSAATAGLVANVATIDLGEHRLKGLESPERIIQVGTDDFPPPRVAQQRKGNLPSGMSHFIGRNKEIAVISERLADHRLVTLLGVGGTGKTRLSIEAATSLAPTYPDGCWIGELAVVATPGAVPLAVAAGLGITAPERGDVTDHIIKRIRHQRLLLIIDNCEHLLSAAADIAERIVENCPAVSVLATSREPLMVNGEQLNPVPPLDPADGVALFFDRARFEAPELDLNPAQHAAIAELCERLDQLPLAIELATSRLRAMTPVEILDRLDERFRLLVGGRRSRMERHQTMRGTLDWSYNLCDPTEQSVFNRLSIFPADFDLAAARALADDLDDLDVIDTIPRLVDRSLLQRTTGSEGTSRYRMLETMRAYGRDHLIDDGSIGEVRDRHARYVAAAVGRRSTCVMGPDERRLAASLNEYVPDALLALDRLIDAEDWNAALATCAVGFYTNERVTKEMIHRVHQAMGGLNVDEDLRREARLADWVTQQRLSREHVSEDAWAMLRSELPAPTHRLALNRFELTLANSADANELLALLQRRTTDPPINQILRGWEALRTIAQEGLTVPDDALQRFRESVAASGSPAAGQLLAEIEGQLAYRSGHWADAAEWCTVVLDSQSYADATSWITVITRFNLVVCRALANQRVRLAEVVRAWDDLFTTGHSILRWRGASATAVALASLGAHELAERFLRWMYSTDPGDVASLFESELRMASLADPVPEAPIDDLDTLLIELRTVVEPTA